MLIPRTSGSSAWHSAVIEVRSIETVPAASAHPACPVSHHVQSGPSCNAALLSNPVVDDTSSSNSVRLERSRPMLLLIQLPSAAASTINRSDEADTDPVVCHDAIAHPCAPSAKSDTTTVACATL